MVIRAREEAAGALGLDVKKRKSNSPPGGVNQGVVACKEKEGKNLLRLHPMQIPGYRSFPPFFAQLPGLPIYIVTLGAFKQLSRDS